MVVHMTKDGRTYGNIAGYGPLPQTSPRYAAQRTDERLPDWLAKKLAARLDKDEVEVAEPAPITYA